MLHDDVIKWKYFPLYLPLVQGIPRSPVNSPHKDQWNGALVFSLICVWTNTWPNNGDAGDLRRHHTHFYVTATLALLLTWINFHPSMNKHHTPSKVWDEITYQFPNFNRCKNTEVWEWTCAFHPALYNTCNHLSILELKLNHVNKGGPSTNTPWCNKSSI